MPAFYNEIDPAAIAVLQHLIGQDVIAPGVVDARSIKDLKGPDLEGFEQVHLFAGGGLWSVAARLAGWPDNRALWTCSCPCQPWGAAGRQKGVDDPRHLWPDVFRLVREAGDARPSVIVGEQVSGKAGYGWLDGVCTDLEGEDYTCGAIDGPACAVNAPHQRNRIYWVAVDNTIRNRRETWRDDHRQHDRHIAGPADQHHFETEELADTPSQRRQEGGTAADVHGRRGHAASHDASDQPRSMGDGIRARLEGHGGHGDTDAGRQKPDRPVAEADGCQRCDMGNPSTASLRQQDAVRRSRLPAGGSVVRSHIQALADSASARSLPAAQSGICCGEEGSGTWHGQPERLPSVYSRLGHADGARKREPERSFAGRGRRVAHPDEGGGAYWSDTIWLNCHDEKARRTKPGLRLLVDGFPGRVDLWRIAGNAIVPEFAAQVIAAVAETIKEEMRAA